MIKFLSERECNFHAHTNVEYKALPKLFLIIFVLKLVL